MTEDEKELILMLNDVYEKYISMPEQHCDDKAEFVRALHVLQHLVMIRSVRRGNPEMFPLHLSTTAHIDSLDDMKPIENAIMETLNNALNNKGGEK